MSDKRESAPDLRSPEAYFNRELSWLAFSRRVLALAEDREIPLIERVKFAGIVGMLHDEFFMKRISGLKRQTLRKPKKRSLDGRTPREELEACREELADQFERLGAALEKVLRPELRRAGHPILEYEKLRKKDQKELRDYFRLSVQPILTPLAADAEHPFPFISNLGLNLAVLLPDESEEPERFVRIKVPDNLPRWVPLSEGSGFVPLEQVIAANLDLMFPETPPSRIYCFRVTRGAEGERDGSRELEEVDDLTRPGSIVRLVTNDLKARRFAGVVRLQVEAGMPKKMRKWLAAQLGVEGEDVSLGPSLLAVNDLMEFPAEKGEGLRYPGYTPRTHPRLRDLPPEEPSAVFREIARGDILLHHPYVNFDSSVLRFLESASLDPRVLAIKLTIYRTNRDSPIVRALAEAARRGKQVAVLVEITARFDEAPNIAWGQYLEKEGVHVSYGVERLKTHVKLALVVREEEGRVRRYLHAGTGNYHTGTARLYEDLGVLTCDPDLCEDAAAVFNSLTGATPYAAYRKMLVAPLGMRERFVELIRREREHARAGRSCGIHAKMNQLQDPEIIRELYAAAGDGVPIVLNVRGLCCLRPGVPGLSEGIRVFGVVGRFLEHSRIYAFTNGGEPEYYIGSADWMKRNLDSRVETIVPLLDARVKEEMAVLLRSYEQDNSSAWDCDAEGGYRRRRPAENESRREVQETLMRRASGEESGLAARLSGQTREA